MITSKYLVDILLVLNIVYAVPVFHTVNDVDLRGSMCPLQTRKDINCYPICVKNLNDCPSDFEPKCKLGWKFCPDGKCHKSCNGLPNICSCNQNTLSEYKACNVEIKIDINSFNKSNEKDQLVKTCESKFQIDNIQQWSNSDSRFIPSEQRYWATCPLPKPVFTYREPMFISVFTIICIEFVLFCLWSIYKSIRERNIESLIINESNTTNNKENETKEKRMDKNNSDRTNSTSATQNSNYVIKGYNNDFFGNIVLYSFFIMSVGWFVWLGVITADYYGAVNGTEFGVAFSSYDLSSGMYIGIWISATTWLVFMNVFRHRLRNHFRLKRHPLSSRFVQIEKPIKTTYMLDDGSKILKIVRVVETGLKKGLKLDYNVTTTPLNKIQESKLFYFNYQCTRYVYNEQTNQFQPFDFHLGDTGHDLVTLKQGLTTKEAKRRVELKGPNFISVYVPSFFGAICEEFTSLFYLYQIMIMWLFYYFAYYEVGLVDTAVILVSALIKVVIRLKSEKRIKSMAEHVSKVNVKRDNEWVELSTSDLVPGDIYEVINNTTVPVDAVVLSGNIVADESSLTGEPLPIRKFPIKDEQTMYDRNGSNKINSLFAGTLIAQSTKASENERVEALVYQTATSTDKGQLIHKILFPSPISFIFDEQLKVVICILGVWGVVLFALSLWMQNKNPTASWFYGMLCLSQILSPLLPAALVVGQSVAAAQLRKKKIFCIDLPRITVAGKIQIFCFDKTGTLTKEGLEYYGSQPTKTIATPETESPDNEFLDFETTFEDLPNLFQLGAATCHSVTEVNGTKIGNPVDIELFNSTNWKITNPEKKEYVDTIVNNNTNRTAHIIKRYEFVHARMSMSVAVLDPVTNNVHIFVKGSFEKVQQLCNKESIPSTYTDTTSNLAMEGCYVLALAHRNLGKIDINELNNWTREKMEEDINIVGLIVFKNKLKEDTTSAIVQLKEGNTRTVMITGDTALTGIYIARLCKMATENSKIYLADLNSQGSDVVWKDVDDKNSKEYLDTGAILAMFGKDGLDSTVELAMTGKAFKLLCENDQIRPLVLNTRVFARMDPQDKVDCVELHMERGITGMCGDGGNDCGALRAAHVGIALSEAEASIVSPFSSNFRSVMACVELLKQGRAALSSSFAGYKYLIMYGEIMACLKIFTFYYSISVSPATWIFIDAFVVVLMSFALSQNKAASKLAPKRPTARLIGPETMFSTLGQVFINFMFTVFAFVMLYKQEFFKCHEFDSSLVDISKWYTLGDNYEAQTLAFVTLYQFINSAFIYNFGYYYRKAFYKNYSLMLLYVGLFCTVSCMLLMDPNWLGCQFRLNCGDYNDLKEAGYNPPNMTKNHTRYNIPKGHNVYPTYFRYQLFGYCIANIIVGIAYERIFVIGPFRNYMSKTKPLNRLKVKL